MQRVDKKSGDSGNHGVTAKFGIEIDHQEQKTDDNGGKQKTHKVNRTGQPPDDQKTQ